MKRFVLLLLVALAMAVGYLLGTEQGRQQRDQIMEAVNKKRGITPGDDIDLTTTEETEQTEAAADTAAEAAAQPV